MIASGVIGSSRTRAPTASWTALAIAAGTTVTTGSPKLRCVRLKLCKRAKAQADFLRSLGVPGWRARILALSGKGWWRKALSYQATEAMTLAWFRDQGLVPSADRHLALQTKGNRRGT